MYEETHGSKDVKSGGDVFEETRGAKDVEFGTDVYEETQTYVAMDVEIGANSDVKGLWTEGNLEGLKRIIRMEFIAGLLVVSVTYKFTSINKYKSFKLFLQVYYVAKEEFS